MQKIQSFLIDHRTLDPGIYVSRIDGDVTTYDLRTRKPNSGDYMDNVTMHSVEHMMATLLRNSSIKDSVVYFGPMGCQTGFYLLVRNANNQQVLEELKIALKATIDHQGPVFGQTVVECGNYQSLDINLAKAECSRYLAILNQKQTPTFQYKDFL